MLIVILAGAAGILVGVIITHITIRREFRKMK